MYRKTGPSCVYDRRNNLKSIFRFPFQIWCNRSESADLESNSICRFGGKHLCTHRNQKRKEKKVKNEAGPHPPRHFSVDINRGVCSLNSVPLRELRDSRHCPATKVTFHRCRDAPVTGGGAARRWDEDRGETGAAYVCPDKSARTDQGTRPLQGSMIQQNERSHFKPEGHNSGPLLAAACAFRDLPNVPFRGVTLEQHDSSRRRATLAVWIKHRLEQHQEQPLSPSCWLQM